MKRYRKKSIIEAEQFFSSKWKDYPKVGLSVNGGFIINTKIGLQEVKDKYWLITNPDGETYPCPEDTFLATYEEV